MLRNAIMLVLALMVCLVFNAIMVTPSYAEKIAVVDANRVANECNAGKRAQAEIKQRFERLNAELSRLNEEIQKLSVDLKKSAALLKPDAKLKKEQDLEAKFRTLNDRRRDAQREMMEAERSALNPILENLSALLKEMGGTEDYTVILDTRTIPYYAPQVDITEKVLSIYNQRYP